MQFAAWYAFEPGDETAVLRPSDVPQRRHVGRDERAAVSAGATLLVLSRFAAAPIGAAPSNATG